MKASLITLILTTLLLSVLSGLTLAEEYSLDEYENMRMTKEAKDQINLLNLINGLHLNSEQLALLEKNNIELQRQQLSYEEQTIAAQKDAVAKYKALQQALIEHGQNVPKEIERPAAKAERRLKELHKQYEKLQFDLAQEVVDKLTDEQKDVIYSYTRCLVPPKHFSDPVRVGQANGDIEQVCKAFDRVRKAPLQVRDRMIDGYLDRAEKKLRRKLGIRVTDQDIQAEKDRLRDIFDQVIEMDETDYLFQREELAAQTDILEMNKQSRLSSASSSQRENQVKVKVSQNLFGKNFAGIYAQVKQRTDSQETVSDTNLSTVENAENCEDGSCAIDD